MTYIFGDLHLMYTGKPNVPCKYWVCFLKKSHLNHCVERKGLLYYWSATSFTTLEAQGCLDHHNSSWINVRVSLGFSGYLWVSDAFCLHFCISNLLHVVPFQPKWEKHYPYMKSINIQHASNIFKYINDVGFLWMNVLNFSEQVYEIEHKSVLLLWKWKAKKLLLFQFFKLRSSLNFFNCFMRLFDGNFKNFLLFLLHVLRYS